MAYHENTAKEIFRQLRSVGIHVNSFAELRRLPRKYHDAVPILLERLQATDDKDIKADIVRSLSMPWVNSTVAQAFVREFEGADDLLLKWAIGNGLSIVADRSVADDVIRLVQDRRHGRAREMLADVVIGFRVGAGEFVCALEEIELET